MEKPCGPERLHAPWRMEYVVKTGGAPTGCVFCAAARAETCDRESLVIYRGTHHFVILNRFPYNCGHLMVVPYIHTAELSDLSPDAQTEMMRLATLGVEALRRAMHPQGFNLGMNLGQVAGAGIADHLHLHVVPRWGGDTNFMPVLGNVRVLPESLERTWQRLCDAMAEVMAEQELES